MLPQFNEDMLKLLADVHISMPWRFLPQYLEMILHYRMNLEIGFDANQLDAVPRTEMNAVASKLQKRGCRITLHGPFWDLSPGSVDSLIRKISKLRLDQFMRIFEIFRPIQVVCHTGYDPRHHGGHRQIWLDHSMGTWEDLVRQAEKLGIPLLLENVWEHDPLLHQEIFRRIPSACFGFCLDVGHQNCFSKTSLDQWIEALSDFLMEMHLHDNNGTRDAHLPIGQGNIDFVTLFRVLEKAGKKPLLTLEPHRKEHLVETLAGLTQVLGKNR